MFTSTLKAFYVLLKENLALQLKRVNVNVCKCTLYMKVYLECMYHTKKMAMPAI
jgi:hypothetical protein